MATGGARPTHEKANWALAKRHEFRTRHSDMALVARPLALHFYEQIRARECARALALYLAVPVPVSSSSSLRGEAAIHQAYP
jgi:hypothetical protein